MCRYELLGRGLLYWQRRKAPLDEELSARLDGPDQWLCFIL